MVIASRIRGRIAPGAMPILHRYIGTPILTFLINLFFRSRLSDCNSGFRCVKRNSYLEWNVKAKGMEFASELLIKAIKAESAIVEIPSGLRESPVKRDIHLRTWRDGTRHLLLILSEKPRLFELGGLALVLISSIIQLVSLFIDPISVLEMAILGLHTNTIMILLAIAGCQLYLIACIIYLSERDQATWITRKLIGLNEAALFLLSLAVALVTTLMLVCFFAFWASSGFSGISVEERLLVAVHFVSVPGTWIVGLLGVHLFKIST